MLLLVTAVEFKLLLSLGKPEMYSWVLGEMKTCCCCEEREQVRELGARGFWRLRPFAAPKLVCV